jgi:hypothetical protein
MAMVERTEISPFVEPRGSEWLVGEEVLFKIGLRSDQPVDALRLADKTCELVILAPDGRRSVQVRGPSSYDGPSTIDNVWYLECLNALVDRLVPGRYELFCRCEGGEAHASVELRARPQLAAIATGLELPRRINVADEGTLDVTIRVCNGGRRVQMVVPDSCYAASVVGYLHAREPPSWLCLEGADDWDGTGRPGYRTRVSQQTRAQLRMLDLEPTIQHTVKARFAGAPARARLRDPQWRPRERFAITVGLIVYIFGERDRPIRLLRGVTAHYRAGDGALQSVDADGPLEHWARVTPSLCE